jgi:hypothetical protein
MQQTLGSSSRDVLLPPIEGGRALTTDQRAQIDLSTTIPGWGSDLDAASRPGVPRDKAPDIGREFLYPPFKQQETDVLILKSTEHERLTPVFGTTCPPRGLSGLIRRIAYRFSEGRLARWMLLMSADRIDVIEGLLEDLVHLRVPHLVREMGLRSELRYNQTRFLSKSALAACCLVALFVSRKFD